jgi:hypothetical protein
MGQECRRGLRISDLGRHQRDAAVACYVFAGSNQMGARLGSKCEAKWLLSLGCDSRTGTAGAHWTLPGARTRWGYARLQEVEADITGIRNTITPFNKMHPFATWF